MEYLKYPKTMSGFISSLGFVFTTLKITHLINWSWWLVLLPIYIIPLLFTLLIALSLIINFIENRRR